MTGNVLMKIHLTIKQKVSYTRKKKVMLDIVCQLHSYVINLSLLDLVCKYSVKRMEYQCMWNKVKSVTLIQ
jgi:hypothetical protein